MFTSERAEAYTHSLLTLQGTAPQALLTHQHPQVRPQRGSACVIIVRIVKFSTRLFSITASVSCMSTEARHVALQGTPRLVQPILQPALPTLPRVRHIPQLARLTHPLARHTRQPARHIPRPAQPIPLPAQLTHPLVQHTRPLAQVTPPQAHLSFDSLG